MPKRGLSPDFGDEKNKLYRAAKYHWEFKRRNDAYRLWWNKGARAKVKPKGWDERFNPDIPFDELITGQVEEALPPRLKMFPSENPNRSHWQSVYEYYFMEEMLPKGVEEDFGPGGMTIKINFNEIKSVSALREHVSSSIDRLYGLYLEHGFLSQSEKSQAGRTKNLNRDFDKIITAGDLKRDGKSYAQIAQTMFPKTIDRVSGKASDAAERDVKRLVKEFKRGCQVNCVTGIHTGTLSPNRMNEWGRNQQDSRPHYNYSIQSLITHSDKGTCDTADCIIQGRCSRCIVS